MTCYKLMGIDDDNNQFEELNELTEQEADERLVHYQRLFPEVDYFILEYEYKEPETECYYNERAVDGWEDLFD